MCKYTCYGQVGTSRAMPCSACITLGSRQTYKWALTVELPSKGRTTHCNQRCSLFAYFNKALFMGLYGSQLSCSMQSSWLLCNSGPKGRQHAGKHSPSLCEQQRFVPLTKGGQFRLPIRKTSKPSSRADGTRLAALHRSSNMPRCITSLRRDSAEQQRLCALMAGVKSQCKQVGCAAWPASGDNGLRQHLWMQVIAAVI